MDMATGELDYDDIFRLFPGGASEGDITTEVPFQAASFTLIILFFLLMPILLNNLIVSLNYLFIPKFTPASATTCTYTPI